MLDFGVVDTFYQGVTSVLVVLLWYYFLSGLFNWKSVLKILVLAFFLGVLSVFVADFILLIMVLINFASQFIQKKNLNYDKSGILLLVVIIQVLIGNIAMFLGRMSVRGLYNVSNLMGVQYYTHELLIIYVIFVIIINYAILFFYRRYCHKIVSANRKIKELNLSKSLFELILIFYVAIESIMLISLNENITATIQLTLITSFIVMLLMMLWQMVFFIRSYMKKQEASYQAKQNTQLNEYLKSVEQQYLELRRFKHDYKNIMLSLQDSISNGSSSEQLPYFKELIAQRAIDTSLDSGKIAKIQHVGNETLRGLIVQKFFDAQTKGIELSLELDQSEFIIKHNLVDVVRIVGNLLDNAIDAAKSTPDKQVTCAFNSLHETKEISVRNSTNKKLDVNKMFELGASTKGSQRGFGLSNVQQLVDKQKNFFLDVDSKNDRVIITLTILEEE
ncbi:GHKL domain-containing protein [Lactiplantibacillus plantarum]|uniref:sensor histidine kinase n=2 Tax=Lactiplantibacillus plantarum TaxID=1590 RepID=UPI001E58ADD4|nr:GHKL domain-containing protein [Lactiplantibacillus plantarum]MCC9315552.1 GHKL domain-containing protein [Lactiplantibacillus plantarum]MEE4616372.1 GHKL domain-containing protein [Lactiplantibacillus plantarum]